VLVGQLELASSHHSAGPGVAHGLLLFGQTAPVAARRAAPTVAAATGLAAMTVEDFAVAPTNTLSAVLAGLVLVYSLARHVDGPRLVIVTALAAGALTGHILRLSGPRFTDLAFALILAAAAWLAGRTLRHRDTERRRAAADAAAERAAAAAALEAAIADERSRIAREMHDIVAHGMGVMVVQAAAAEQLIDTDPSSAREPLRTVRQTGQGALAEMRRLLGLLRAGGDTDSHHPQPGLEQLPALVDQLAAAGMSVTIAITGTPVTLPPGLQLCAYRIVQEALTNALKHAHGASTRVALEYRPDALALSVHNDGTGDPALGAGSNGAGHGLVGMRERVRLYGGTLTAQAAPDGSFLVDAVLPTR